MPKFNQESFSKLSTCHIDLQVLFFEVVRTFDCVVLEGYRNQEDQEKAFKDGNTTLPWPHGKHNYQPSNAVDVAPCPIDEGITKRHYLFAGYVLAVADQLKQQQKMTHSVRWGGDWDGDKDIFDQKMNDLLHFELIL